MKPELRLYTFVNFYLSSIQQGIQSAHVVHTLFTKYPTEANNQMLWDWAKNDKTMIVLNGGANADIDEISETLYNLRGHSIINNMPMACFEEDEQSLGGIRTAVGIVVPDFYYNAVKTRNDAYTWTTSNEQLYIAPNSYIVWEDKSKARATHVYLEGSAEHTFVSMLKSCTLAR